MRKKLLILFLTIVSAVCLCIGISACSSSDSSVNGTYYKYSNDSYDYSSYFALKDGNWTDDSGASGTYTVSGTTIVFYTVFFGENVEFVDGTISDGVLTYYIGTTACIYCKEGKTPSGNTESGGNTESDDSGGSTTVVQYIVTYDANGGSFSDGSATYTQTVNANYAFSAPTSPTREGYTFEGWKYNNSIWSFVNGISEDITLTAVWSAIEYNITYKNVDGATNTNPEKYTIENSSIILSDAVKAGYTFEGWYSDSALTQGIISIVTSGMKNITVYAKWALNEYTASFYVDGQLVDSSQFTVEDEKLSEPSIPDKTGYTGAWEYTISANDLTVSAVYTPIEYSINYEGTKDATNSNPAAYTIESEKITLSDITADGYTFLGWYDDSDTQVTEITTGSYGNITLTAKWEVIVYTISYEYDDKRGVLPEDATFTTTYTIEDSFDFVVLECSVVGYTFSGWYTEKVNGTGDKVEGIALGTTGNKTYYAQWGLETYTITYHNTEDATNTNATNYTIESSDITIVDISRIGYTFEGWYSDENLTVAANTTIVTGSTGDIDFYAKWSAIDYTITYNLYGGTNNENNPDTYTIESGAALANSTLSGYYFVGWYTAAENGNLVAEITKGTTGNITLYARWLAIDSNGGTDADYAITFNADGVTITGAPTKTYYDFAGWYTDSNLTSAYNNSLPASTITLYAKWTPTEYTINYVLNGGTNSESNPATYNIEDTVTFAAPSKTGYNFNGWYSDEIFTSAIVEGISAGNHGEITIYANFSINQYTISFESNGGTDVAAITQNYATEVTAPAEPAKNGYTFAGWYLDSLLTTAYSFSKMPAEDITLYAKWDAITYDIVYNLDGGTNSSSNPSTYKITSSTVTLASPSKTGYIFKGWYTDSSYTTQITQIANGSYGDLELFAKWEIITYTINYEIDTEAVNTNITEYTVETDLTTLIDATLTGYSFNGWYSDNKYTTAVTTIAGGSVGNITLYGKFTANTYNVWLDGSEEASVTVTFDLNGASGTAPAAQTITETTTLTYPDVPTRSGYLFGGWYTTADCTGTPFDFSGMIGSNITLYAKWVNLDGENGIDINGTATVTLSGTTEQVYYFIPLASGNVSITTTGSIDTLGTLYKDGTLLKQDDDSGSDSNFLITYNVTAGEVYEIRVRGFSSSTSGDITLSVSGSNTVADGGYTRAGNKTTITYGSTDYTLTVATSEGNYKFLGWADINGVYYTDAEGNAIRAWDIGEDTTLYSQWEKMEYTVTFVANGGTEVASVTLEYGARLDLNLYTTTRDGYTFGGWYLSASDTESYNASTMPDGNITLYAKWITYSLGSIKYDEDKLAISVYDTINADLFSALCIDTDGMPVDITVTVSGTQEAGNTISVRLVATNNGKTAQKTIQNIQVYGDPTLTVTNSDIGYVNLSEMDGDWFGASGTDTFGEATTITVRVADGYSAGDIATVYIDSTDPAGNVTTQAIENVALYGIPVISVTNTDIKSENGISVDSLGATAVDSFGESVDVGISTISYSYETTTSYNYIYFTALSSESYTLYYRNGESGDRTYIYVHCITTNSAVISNGYYTNSGYYSMTFSVTAGYEYYIRTYAYSSSYTTTFYMYLESPSSTISTVTTAVEYDITLSATDSKGNVGTKTVTVKVYDSPTINNATTTEFTESDVIDVESLGITATDTYGEELEITLTLTSGTQVGGNTMIYTATVTDAAGNVTTKDISVKIYGTPTIMIGRTNITVDETIALSSFSVKAKDSFGASLTVTYEYVSGSQTGGTYMTYSFTTTDKLGNSKTVTKTIAVYDINDISFTYSNMASDVIKLTSKGEEFFASATDTFGNACEISIVAADGYALAAGETISLYIVATDAAGNSVYSELISGIKVYGTPTIVADDTYISSSTDLDWFYLAYDSFGEELSTTVTIVSGTQTVDDILTVLVTATDSIGNVAEKYYVYEVDNKVSSMTLEYENYTVEFDYSKEEITIISYDGTESKVVIPETIYGHSVIAIAERAFANCTCITSVVVPDSVTSIGAGAFSGCSSLISISLPFVGGSATNNKYLGYIFGASSYSYNSSYVPSSLKTVIVTGGTIIDSSAFEGCTSLESITIPDSVTSIGSYAFYYCTSLKSVTIGNSVTSIGSDAFDYCISLESVYYSGTASQWASISFSDYSANPLCYAYNLYLNGTLATDITIEGITTIHGYAFNNCSSLTIVTIGDSVETIGSYAFNNCSSLTSVTIPDSVTSIGYSAFKDCTSLISISLPFVGGSATNNKYLGYIFGASSYSNNSSVVPSSLKTVIVTGGTIIDSYAFYYCTSLKSVTIGNSVTSIGVHAFYYCTSLKSVTIGNSVTSIGYYAFYECTSLTSVTIPDSVTSIGVRAFAYCDSLISVTIGNSVTSIGDYAFEYCTSLTSVTIPDSVTSIGDYAFEYCRSLTSITIGNSVTSIGDYAFYGCSSLECVYYIGTASQWASISFGNECANPLYHAYNLYLNGTLATDITIEGITTINSYAFRYCTALTSVTIGNGVTSIGSGAFVDCYKLVEVYNLSSLTITAGSKNNGYVAYYAKNVYTATSGESKLIYSGDYVFYNDNETYYLVAFTGTDTNITLPNGINGNSYSIYKYALYGCYSLTRVTIPDSVTSIGNYAFRGCTSLTSVTIGNGVKSIASYAFRECTSLESATIESGSIGEDAFYHCTSLTSVTIGNGVTSIGSYAFYECTSLTSVTIGNGVTSIGNYAFSGCTALTRVTIGNSVTSIGSSAFYRCTSLESVTFTNTSGWYRTTTSGATSGTSVSSTTIANTSTMATYLTSMYRQYYWYRSEG